MIYHLPPLKMKKIPPAPIPPKYYDNHGCCEKCKNDLELKEEYYDITYFCKKCYNQYTKSLRKWSDSWCNYVAVADIIETNKDGEIIRSYPQLEIMRIPHGGNKLSKGDWCDYDENGHIKKVNKPSTLNMIVI